jgi:3-oxoacyl-(acyl-carrier-protein) synthase
LDRDTTGEGLARAIKIAINNAGIEAEELDLVMPLGYGHPEKDLVEAKGIRAGLASAADKVHCLPLRGQLGNAGAGASALDLATAAAILMKQDVPSAVNCDNPCPQCGLSIVTSGDKPEKLRYVAVTSYALAGQNACVILKRFEKEGS